MKIVVLNSSGNVGKSTITKEFLYPRLTDALIVEIETINASNINNGRLNITRYDVNEDISDLYMKCIENENIIVDIGASNLSAFFEKVLDFEGFLDMFDYFVIPSVSTIKETEDTIKTILFLQNIGVAEEKIKVIPNKVKNDVDIEFSVLFKNTPIEIDKTIFIKESKLFSDLALLKMDIKEVYQDDLDFYKPKIIDAETPKEKMRFIKMDMCNRMAHSLIKNFDEMFENLFGVSSQKGDTNTSRTSLSSKENNEEEINVEESEDF